MAASVTLKGDTYTYTISNIQNAITMTPSNRNSRYGAVYTTKPTIKRNKSGSANSRWIFIWFGTSAEATPTPYALVTSWYVVYKAVFTKTGTTATVSEVYASDDIPLGYLAGRMAYSGFASNTGKFLIGISTTSTHVDIWTSTTGSAGLTMSGWNPTTDSRGNNQPTVSYQVSQASAGDPDPSVFGYIAGYAKASWAASGDVYWTFNYGSYVGSIVPKQTLSLSANGASNTSAAGTGSRSASLAGKVLNATSVTGTAKLTNVIGGSSTRTATATVQAYSQPIAKSLAIGRVKQNNEDRATMSIGWAVDILNKQSNVTQSIESGDISCAWECEDLSNPDTVFSSGTFNIVNDGEAMTKTTDTTPPIVLVDASGNNHNDYDPDKSFKFTAYITDRIGESSLSITAVLASEFYLICAREGGRGIGFGMVPPDDAMHVNMPATFYDNVEAAGGGVFGDDVSVTGDVTATGDVTDGAGNTLSNKRSAAFVQMYHGNQALNNTARKITGLSISAGGNYSDYFDVGTADQVTIKKTGGYRIDMAMRFSAVTNAGNVKRISLYRNGSEFVVLMSRANSWEDFSTFYTQDLSVGDVLTMYGRSEDGNATASIERIYIEPIP